MIFKTENEKLTIFGNTLGEIKKKFDDFKKALGKHNLFGENGAFASLFSGKNSKNILTPEVLSQLDEFKKKFNSSSLSAEALAEEMGNVDSSIINYAKTCKNGEMTTEGFKASVEEMTLRAKAAAVATQALSAVLNMAASFGITLAIQGLVQWLDSLSTTLAEQKVQLADTMNSIAGYESEQSELEGKLAENQKKIDTLNANPLDIVDKNTLSTLEAENTELNQQLETIKAIKKDAKELAEVQTVQILENTAKMTAWEQVYNNLQQGKYFENPKNLNTGIAGLKHGLDDFKEGNIAGGLKKWMTGVLSPVGIIDSLIPKKENEKSITEETEDQIKSVTKLRTELQELEKQRGSIDEEEYRKNHTDLTQKYTDENSKLIENIQSLRQYKETLDETDPNQLEWINNIQAVEDKYTASMAKSDKYNTFDKIINSEAYGSNKDELIELANQGKLTADILDEKYHNMSVLFRAIGLELDDVVIKFKKMGETEKSNPAATPSFSHAFSSLESNDRDELLGYAKAGKLTPDILSSNEKYADILKAVGGNAELAARKINSMVSSSDQLASMKTGISSITDILGQKKENLFDEKTKNVGIGADILASMPEDVKACTKEYKNFCKVLGDGSSGMTDCHNAANRLASAYINNNNFLSQLDDSNQDYYKSVLTQMGVTNADEIVTNALARSKALAAFESHNLSEMSAEEIEKLIEETATTEDAASALRAYALEKIFANGKALDTKEDITQLMNLLDAFGIAAPAIKRYLDYLNGTYNTSEPGGMNPNYLKKQADKDAKRAIKKLQKLQQHQIGKNDDNKKGNKNQKKKLPAAKEAKQEIDWIDRKLTSISNKLSFIQAKYENIASIFKKAGLSKVVSEQNKNLDSQIKILKKLKTISNRSSSKYAKKANSIKISKDKKQDERLKKLVRSESKLGKKTSYKTLIKKYGQSTADRITAYQNWYDKSVNAKKSAEDYKKQITEKRIQKYQNNADLYQSLIDKQSARKEIDTNEKLKDVDLKYQNSAKQKEKHINKQIGYTNKLYAAQKKIAELEGNDQKVEQLEAERKKAIVEYQIENLQNYADEKEAAYTLKNTQASMTTDYKKKNSFSKEAVTALKSQYKYLTDIAKKQGDSVEAKRLELELTQKIREAEKERIENITADYENRLIANNRRMQIWENATALAETKGMTVSAKFYQAMADVSGRKVSKQQEELSILMEQYNALMKAHQNDPSFFESQEFFDIVNKINEESDALEQQQINYAKLEQQAIEANWSIAESAQQAVDSLNNEAETFKTIFENKGMFDKNCAITEEGTAVFALDIYEMQNHIAKIKEYHAEIDKLNKLYKEGKISPEKYTEQMQKLKDGVLNSSEAIYSIRDALKSLVEEGLNGELDALNDMIDKVKKNLSDASSLREYKKNIEKQTENIASLERQINAKMGDTSESGRAAVQKLKVQLEDAKSDLEDTEYDKYIEDQERILDDLSDNFQDYLDSQLEQVDTLLEDIISAVESGKVDISDAIKKVGDKIGVDLSKVLSPSLNRFAATGNGDADKVYSDTENNLNHSADAIFKEGADKPVIDTDDKPGKVETNLPGSTGSLSPRPTEEDTEKMAAKAKSTIWLYSKGFSEKDIKKMYASLDNAQALFTGLQSAASGISAEDIYNAYWKEINKGHVIEGSLPISSYSETQPYLDRQKRITNNDNYVNKIAEIFAKSRPPKNQEEYQTSNIVKYGSQMFASKYGKGNLLSEKDAKNIDSYVKKLLDVDTGKAMYPTDSADNILKALININGKYNKALSDAAKGKIGAGKIVGVGGFSKGGIVDTSTLSKIAEKNGDDGWVTVKSGEGILSPIDTQNILELTKILRGNNVSVPDNVDLSSGMTNLPIPSNTISTNNTMNGDMNIHLDGSNINDFDTFADAYINCFQHSPKMRNFFFNGIASGLTNDTLAYRR